jgi:hypothetical protein
MMRQLHHLIEDDLDGAHEGLIGLAWKTIVVTRNGLTVTEDLARRLSIAGLDAQCEDPENS